MRALLVAFVIAIFVSPAGSQERAFFPTNAAALQTLCSSNLVALEGRCVGFIEGVVRTVLMMQDANFAPRVFCPEKAKEPMATIVGKIAFALNKMPERWKERRAEEFVNATLEALWPCRER